MFTGLVQTTGTLLSIGPRSGVLRLVIAAPELAGRWREGDSIAVNGVCLTAIRLEDDKDDAKLRDDPDAPQPVRFAADLAEETVRRTTLARLAPGALLNLELPTPAGSPLGGHVVQGHVDGTGRLLSLRALQSDLELTDWRLAVVVPAELAGNVIPQGSITLDGISLTVASLRKPDADGNVVAEIAIIPHTYRSTNLRSLLSGAAINIETDVLSKYAGKRLASAAAPSAASPVAAGAELAAVGPPVLPAESPGVPWLTTAYLLANGY